MASLNRLLARFLSRRKRRLDRARAWRFVFYVLPVLAAVAGCARQRPSQFALVGDTVLNFSLTPVAPRAAQP